MKHFPTTTDLTNLGVCVAAEGFGPHEAFVAEIVAYGQTITPSPALDELGDRSAPTIVRQRALACVSAAWDEIAATYQRRCVEFDHALAEFLTAWNAHESQRTDGDIARLADSATRLQQLRDRAAQARAALAA